MHHSIISLCSAVAVSQIDVQKRSRLSNVFMRDGSLHDRLMAIRWPLIFNVSKCSVLPMDFKSQYVHRLRALDPIFFRQLMRTGQIDDHLQRKSEEAHQLLEELLASEPQGPDGLPRDLQAQRLAEEYVIEVMCRKSPLPNV
jgi:hypothetical protein